MSFHFRTKYLDDEGTLELARYHDGSIAMRLFSPTEGPLSTPTQCLSEYGEKPAMGNVFLRDDAEFSGMLQCLQDLGIVGPPIRTVPCGFVEAYECELLVSLEIGGVRAL